MARKYCLEYGLGGSGSEVYGYLLYGESKTQINQMHYLFAHLLKEVKV
jgi:hypothetical protein